MTVQRPSPGKLETRAGAPPDGPLDPHWEEVRRLGNSLELMSDLFNRDHAAQR